MYFRCPNPCGLFLLPFDFRHALPSPGVNEFAQNVSLHLNVPTNTPFLHPSPLSSPSPTQQNQPYLLTDYNRDGASHRSPWSNRYFPTPAPSSASSLFYPSDSLRALEVEANALFQVYRELYYDGLGSSSVYFWDLNDKDDPNGGSSGRSGGGVGGFAGCFAIKKGVTGTRAFRKGTWDSMHVVEVQPTARGAGATGPAANYKLTTTVQVSVVVESSDVGEVCLAGVVTRTTQATHAVVGSTGGHVGNMGRMIEDMEISLRGDLDALYVQRTREIVNSVRKMPPPVATEGGGLGSKREGQAAPFPRVGVNAASVEHTQSLFAAIAKQATLRGNRDGDVLEG